MLPKIKLIEGNTDCIPSKAHDGDAGFDVFNALQIEKALGPGEYFKFPLGFAIEIPEGWCALIQARSGLASLGLTTIGNVIDSTYRGEVHAIVLNASNAVRYIAPGMKIAQMLIIPCYTGITLNFVKELTPTKRGQQGFGSTGN